MTVPIEGECQAELGDIAGLAMVSFVSSFRFVTFWTTNV